LDLSSLPADAFTRLVDVHYSRTDAKATDTAIAAVDALAAGAPVPPLSAVQAAAAAVAAAAAAAGQAGFGALDRLDPASHVRGQVTVMFVVDISSLMPPPVKVESPAEGDGATAAAADLPNGVAAADTKMEVDAAAAAAEAAEAVPAAAEPEAMETDAAAAAAAPAAEGDAPAAAAAADAPAAAADKPDAAADSKTEGSKEAAAAAADTGKKEQAAEKPKEAAPPPPPPSIALTACRLGKQLLEPHAYTLSGEWLEAVCGSSRVGWGARELPCLRATPCLAHTAARSCTHHITPNINQQRCWTMRRVTMLSTRWSCRCWQRPCMSC
jgi:hypothetical protein